MRLIVKEVEFYYNYSSFTGNYFKKEKFNKGQTIDFHFSSNRVRGEISAKVVDSAGKTIAKLKKEESLKIDKTDTYKIEVDAKGHQGNFTLTWQ